MRLYVTIFLLLPSFLYAQEIEQDIQALQHKLHAAIEKVEPAFVFIGGGSGVVISPDGWMLTNHHVAGPTGKKWKVRLAGGKKYRAKVIGHDPKGDISLLKIDTNENLPYVELGDSDKLNIGDYTIAVGNPFLLGNGKGAAQKLVRDGNWEPTITFGIISAVHRFQDWYMDAVQTDAQVNPGNSGGPLFTLDGKLVGINGRIHMRFFTRVNTGVGYAIPINQIKRYMKLFKKGGRVYHGYIEGITITECGDDRYENSGEYGDGVLVAGVSHPSPASKAGFETGDIIVEIEGHRVFNANRFHGVIGTFPPGARVKVRVKRGSEFKTLKVIAGNPDIFAPREEDIK